MVEVHSDIGYWEYYNGFDTSRGDLLSRDAVVFSNFLHITAATLPAPGLCVRYVARGCENYRIGGRGYRLEEGQVMIAPQDDGAECEVRKVERTGTLGLCTLIYGATQDLDWSFGPLILGGRCSSVGPLLDRTARKLWSGSSPKQHVARQLVGGLRLQLPTVADTVVRQAAAVDGAKPATRFEIARKANLAQAYLHSTTQRAIELDELSAAVGVSPFRLLKGFQQCFGTTPAAYHRRLRLTLALEEARRRDLPISAIADDYGFAGASAFSHAYRRAFGHAPVWRKRG